LKDGPITSRLPVKGPSDFLEEKQGHDAESSLPHPRGGGVGWVAALTGGATQGRTSLSELIRNEKFNLSGHSEQTLYSIFLSIRELDDIDRPH